MPGLAQPLCHLPGERRRKLPPRSCTDGASGHRQRCRQLLMLPSSLLAGPGFLNLTGATAPAFYRTFFQNLLPFQSATN